MPNNDICFLCSANSCSDNDECASAPCVNGICVDGIDQYTCRCNPGWTGTNCDISNDECASTPCVNGLCRDETNQYTCVCDPGWTGNNCDITQTGTACRQGSCWHVRGGYRVSATCENGYCVCDSPDYSRESCLPSVGSCQIQKSVSVSAAHASRSGTEEDTYSCVTGESGQHDIHVLGVHGGNSFYTDFTDSPIVGNTSVILETHSQTNRPVVLVLASHSTVRWVLYVTDMVDIDEIVLIAHNIDETSVDWSGTPRDNVTVTKLDRSIPHGYGSDGGGGNTVGLLKYIRDNYGPVKTFTGTHTADFWTLDISYGNTTDNPITPGTDECHSDPCVNGYCIDEDAMYTCVCFLGYTGVNCETDVNPGISSDTWTLRSFRYDNNWNDCDGQQYVKSTGYDVGAYVGVVLCSSTRYKIFLNDDLHSNFRNIADSSGHGQDHCELVGTQDSTTVTIDNDFWLSPSSVGYYRSTWGDEFQTGNIGGGIGENWTGKYYVKWYECGVSIP
ncbi:uncharacterized protein [Amphiura filiformis]|uniref:uncharacterized protein n=1 Tax=Amphiura filiformis TaxID=82378 RepID=UPI003B219CAB